MSGPFTVESLSPHRTISVDERIEIRENLKMTIVGPDNFATMILDNLKKAGVQNTIKGERLKCLNSLEPFRRRVDSCAGNLCRKESADYADERKCGQECGESAKICG